MLGWLRSHPLEALWRLVGWGAVTAVTVVAAHGVQERVWAGITIGFAALAIQFTGDHFPMPVTTTAIVAATVFGLVSVLISHSGLGEVPAYVAAARIPFSVRRRPGQIFIIADTIAVGAVVGYVSHSVVGVLAGLGIPVLAERAGERRELIASRDQAQALLVEVQAGREAEAEAAALRERSRIARELHDVLAHSLAGLSVQLQAARAVAARDGAATAVLAPLDQAAALARNGLAEARQLVGALRDPTGLGLAEIPALIARQPGDVTLEVTGTPVAVDPEAGHAIYRAVQEALTNAARYAPGAPIHVTLAYAPDELQVSVDDAGRPIGRSPVSGQGTGLGLVGLDERVRAVGGTVTAGPRPDGGWRVQLHIPVVAGSAA